MNNSIFIVLLICVLALIPVVLVIVLRHRHGTLRRDDGTPVGFGMDPSLNPGSPGLEQSGEHHHHHHHHHSTDGGHQHSHGGSDGGGSHHSGGSDGGASSGGHH